MTLNFTIFAQNNEHNYVEQAALCAMSIHHSNPGSKVCLITNDTVLEKHKQLFTDIIPIPWGDMVRNENWKVANRWKIYHATPFENTLVIDSDMLVLSNITHWEAYLDQKDLFFASKVKNYRNKIVSSDFYRKAFTENGLPNLYSGLHFFKKTDYAHEFYKVLELVMKNWQNFYEQYPSISKYQKVLSVDVSAAIASKILDNEQIITDDDDIVTFTHMKYHCQDWKVKIGARWQDKVSSYLTDDLNLIVGGYKQIGLFHYTEKDFLKNRFLFQYEKVLGI
jgi:hypothetical protein